MLVEKYKNISKEDIIQLKKERWEIIAVIVVSVVFITLSIISGFSSYLGEDMLYLSMGLALLLTCLTCYKSRRWNKKIKSLQSKSLSLNSHKKASMPTDSATFGPLPFPLEAPVPIYALLEASAPLDDFSEELTLLNNQLHQIKNESIPPHVDSMKEAIKKLKKFRDKLRSRIEVLSSPSLPPKANTFLDHLKDALTEVLSVIDSITEEMTELSLKNEPIEISIPSEDENASQESLRKNLAHWEEEHQKLKLTISRLEKFKKSKNSEMQQKADGHLGIHRSSLKKIESHIANLKSKIT